MSKQSKQREEEKMEPFTMRMPPSLVEQAKQKAGMIPLSKIIRKLVEKWISGEIIIEQTRD